MVYLCKGRLLSAFVVAAIFIGCLTCTIQTVSAKTEISAKAYIVMDLASGEIISSKNEDAKMPIASTTKIMTALIALEQADAEESFEVNEAAIMVEGTSMGLRKNDKVTLNDLAKGMLLASGNDAANTAAYKIAGSNENFAKIMNERAAKIGMKNTNFVTPSGLDSKEHYSTAYDMALLAASALDNEDFAEICKSQKLFVRLGTDERKLTLKNHNRLLKEYEGCVGVKTGFTKKAGRCLVTATSRDGATLICVTLSAPDDWNDHKKLLDDGFSKLKVNDISVYTDSIAIEAVGGQQSRVKCKTASTISTTLTESELSSCEKMVLADKFYYAPIYENQYLGEVQYLRNGITVASVPVVAAETVPLKEIQKEKINFLEKLKSLFK